MKRLGTLIAIAVLTSACGGADPAGPRAVDDPEYAQIVVAADTLFWRDLDETTAQFARAGPETVAASTAFGTFALLAGRYAQTLAAVAPSDVVVAEHDAYIAGLELVSNAFDDAAEGREQVSCAAVLVEEPELRGVLDAANAAVRQSCRDLQQALGDAGFSVGLRCDSFV